MNRYLIWSITLIVIIFVRYCIFLVDCYRVIPKGDFKKTLSFRSVVVKELVSLNSFAAALLLASIYLAAAYLYQYWYLHQGKLELVFLSFVLLTIIDILHMNELRESNQGTVGLLANYSLFALLHLVVLFTIAIYYSSHFVFLPLIVILFISIFPLLAGRGFWLKILGQSQNKLLVIMYYSVYFIFINTFIFVQYFNKLTLLQFLIGGSFVVILEGVLINNFEKIKTVFTGVRGVAYYNFIFSCIIGLFLIQLFLSV